MSDPSRELNVMHVILTLERAGAQEVVRTLCDHLAPMGCGSVVCTFEDGPVRRDLEQMGIPVEVLGLRRHGIEALPRFVLEMAAIRRALARLVRRYEIDVVQTHLLQTLDFLTLTLRRGTGLEGVIWTIHNVEFLPEGDRGWSAWKRSVHRSLYRRTAGTVSRIVAVSDEVRAAILSQIGPVEHKVVTIRNGVDPGRYDAPGDKVSLCREIGVDPASPLILTVGRLTEQKGHRYLLAAAVRILRSRPDACFLLVGEGELREDLAESARDAGIADRLRFLGVREDVPYLLASTDVFVLPSVWEGLSVALLEAMAAGAPIVATGVSGTREAMVPGETGEVVPPRDAARLADAVEGLLSNPARARALGRSARKRVTESFGARKQAAEHLALYREIVASS